MKNVHSLLGYTVEGSTVGQLWETWKIWTSSWAELQDLHWDRYWAYNWSVFQLIIAV